MDRSVLAFPGGLAYQHAAAGAGGNPEQVALGYSIRFKNDQKIERG
jgi:hypothetical protein